MKAISMRCFAYQGRIRHLCYPSVVVDEAGGAVGVEEEANVGVGQLLDVNPERRELKLCFAPQVCRGKLHIRARRWGSALCPPETLRHDESRSFLDIHFRLHAHHPRVSLSPGHPGAEGHHLQRLELVGPKVLTSFYPRKNIFGLAEEDADGV